MAAIASNTTYANPATSQSTAHIARPDRFFDTAASTTATNGRATVPVSWTGPPRFAPVTAPRAAEARFQQVQRAPEKTPRSVRAIASHRSDDGRPDQPVDPLGDKRGYVTGARRLRSVAPVTVTPVTSAW